jgi:hypothetical protein
MMTRRTFLRIAGFGVLPVGVGVAAWHESVAWFFRQSQARLSALVLTPEERLRAHFDYLDIDPAALIAFFQDVRRYSANFSATLPLGPHLHTQFLLSTDFFMHGADEARLLKYVGYYDPNMVVCNNPLARFDG